MKNINMEDRLHVVKTVSKQNINVSYENSNQDAKEKKKEEALLIKFERKKQFAK